MSDIAIKVENLSKRYRIGAKEEQHETMMGSLIDMFRMPVRNLRKVRSLTQFEEEEQEDIIWALKDVSFEVKRGEVVGIIGRNGAGKSTLLKILSRITPPTSGKVELKGRVSSLLEVGTGFHRELTGRENIYLNGAILGMTKKEIDKKFDEIVDFSGVEKFIDTPVKRYSSGMKVRLAFSVAAHLEPEILMIDEVLAVGDVEFQKKCLGKMESVAEEGRTVLFVSHNMAAVISLCNKGFLIDSGQINYTGNMEAVVNEYLQTSISLSQTFLNQRTDRKGNGEIQIESLSISNDTNNNIIKCSDKIIIRIRYTATNQLSNTVFLIGIYDQLNRPIFFLDSRISGGLTEDLPVRGVVVCRTDQINLTPGQCIVNVAVLVGGIMADHIGHANTFYVEADDFFGTGKMVSRQNSLFLLKHEWQIEEIC